MLIFRRYVARFSEHGAGGEVVEICPFRALSSAGAGGAIRECGFEQDCISSTRRMAMRH
jgi:hypothetical protein